MAAASATVPASALSPPPPHAPTWSPRAQCAILLGLTAIAHNWIYFMGPTSIHHSVQQTDHRHPIRHRKSVQHSLHRRDHPALHQRRRTEWDRCAGWLAGHCCAALSSNRRCASWLADGSGWTTGGYRPGLRLWRLGFPGQRTGIGPRLLLGFMPWLRLDRRGQRGQPTEPLHCRRSLADRTTGACHRLHRLCGHGGGDLRPACWLRPW